MAEKYKRINVLITPEQHRLVGEHDLSLSGLIRDLLDDWFSGNTITLSVTHPTKKLYDSVISHFDVSDEDLEPHIVEALDKVLATRSKEIDSLRKKLKDLPGSH